MVGRETAGVSVGSEVFEVGHSKNETTLAMAFVVT